MFNFVQINLECDLSEAVSGEVKMYTFKAIFVLRRFTGVSGTNKKLDQLKILQLSE